MRILLINPPGKKTYIRDYYCSKVSKSSDIFQPTDLLYLSGHFPEDELQFIDSILDSLSVSQVLRKVQEFSPDVCFVLVGAVSLSEDSEFVKQLSEYCLRVFVLGDIFLENATEVLVSNFHTAEGAILDFLDPGIREYLSTGDQTLIATRYASFHRNTKSLPIGIIPRTSLFVSPKYTFPFAKTPVVSVFLSDYGCPYSCSFCVQSTLSYKVRDLESIREELQNLSLAGVTELFVHDQTFGINFHHAVELCKLFKIYQFSWTCFSRVDLATDEYFQLLSSSGCHTIIFGVEFGTDSLLQAYSKGYTTKQISDAFLRSKQYSIRTVATFLLGVPEETEESILATSQLISKLSPDYLSVNVLVPRAGTKIRPQLVTENLSGDLTQMDQSGEIITLRTRSLTSEQLLKYRSRILRRFYLRPSYLVRRFFSLRSRTEVSSCFRAAKKLLKQFFR